jgi:small-conductance mechanosensitive channel
LTPTPAGLHKAAVQILGPIDRAHAALPWLSGNRDGLLLGTAIAAGVVALMLVLRWLGRSMAAGDPDCRRWHGVIGRVLAKTSVLFMVAVALDIVISDTAVPRAVARIIDAAFILAFVLQGAIWARELILGLIGRRSGDDGGESAHATAGTAVSLIASIALFAIAIVVILDNVGVDVTALIAGLGIGGIAIGLAAQGIFSDLFAALSILFDRPFRRGDQIKYGNSIGTVDKIGMKSTRVRSLDGQTLIIANTKLLEQEIHNLSEGDARRTTFRMSIVYQTPPDLIEEVPEIARAVVEKLAGCTFVRCGVIAPQPSGIEYELLFDSGTLDFDVIYADRTVVLAELMRAFAERGIALAYPTLTTFTAATDQSWFKPYSREPASDAGARSPSR